MGYVVVGTPRSRAMRVIWALEELRLDFEIEPAGARSDGAVAANPSGKIPSLRTPDGVLTDSVAIMTFLADRHGAADGTLTWPAGTVERARQDAATQLVLEELDAPLWSAARHTRIYPEAARAPEIVEVNKREVAAGFDVISTRLGDAPFLAGERFTSADILAGHCFGWAKLVRWPPPTQPNLVAYLERIYGRPANDRARTRARAAMAEVGA